METAWLPPLIHADATMKIPESGMPEEELWETFFEADAILEKLGFADCAADAVEFGCGYGTFTTAAARRTTGTFFALDIDPAMVAATGRKVRERGLGNVRVVCRDFVAEGTGLGDASAGYAMLFNILHADNPVGLLREAYRVLQPGGKVGIIHWNYDATTPRGPAMRIRPRIDQGQVWTREAGFELTLPCIALPPYHYGIVGTKLSTPTAQST